MGRQIRMVFTELKPSAPVSRWGSLVWKCGSHGSPFSLRSQCCPLFWHFDTVSRRIFLFIYSVWYVGPSHSVPLATSQLPPFLCVMCSLSCDPPFSLRFSLRPCPLCCRSLILVKFCFFFKSLCSWDILFSSFIVVSVSSFICLMSRSVYALSGCFISCVHVLSRRACILSLSWLCLSVCDLLCFIIFGGFC